MTRHALTDTCRFVGRVSSPSGDWLDHHCLRYSVRGSWRFNESSHLDGRRCRASWSRAWRPGGRHAENLPDRLEHLLFTLADELASYSQEAAFFFFQCPALR